MPALVVRSSIAALASVACLLLAPGVASAQPPFAAPAAPPPSPPEPPPPPAPPAPVLAPAGPPGAMAAPQTGATDHDTVVGRWGIEARHLGTFRRSPGNDLTCNDACNLSINALSLRRWHTARYAWSVGLALGAGGGSRSDMGTVKSWDTYLGFGPTLGASFLKTNWKHLTVSLSPQLDVLFFIPRSSGPKDLVINLRGLVEGELHLGFIGLPEVSLGLSSGVVATYHATSKPEMTASGQASRWDVGFSGPQSLWGLVTNTYLRFYF